jgi:hypothetical protein
MVHKNAVFWNVTTCDSCKNRRLGGTYRLRLQAEKNKRARNNVSSNQQPKRTAKKHYHSTDSIENISSQRASVAGYC